ncbi:unnamed protein product, partial [Rotaria socialis]
RIVTPDCSSNDRIRTITINDTEEDISNRSLANIFSSASTMAGKNS